MIEVNLLGESRLDPVQIQLVVNSKLNLNWKKLHSYKPSSVAHVTSCLFQLFKETEHMVKFHKALISRIEASSYCWNNRLCGPDMSSSFRVMAKSGWGMSQSNYFFVKGTEIHRNPLASLLRKIFLSKCQNIIPNYIEKLYEFDERLSQSTEKSKVRLRLGL
ncbi:hypothetical protein YC2023_109451 [Brassica napus]